ncbi:response regulator [Dactylosporangium sucinum]|uniref:DNA-binding response regulator n=1 Tax=Dactylosporangium sucinum TaxID=1424081 RepID=A0A917UDL9_9ACTN|nr:response regulator transcription factor [Dactylosporangium sucinum]GGM85389.1 DNA-binding response regulator [Dactylosporangium sucinum]
MSGGASIRVAVVDDHPVFRLGMVALIETLDGMECVGDAADVASAVVLAGERHPDVVLMDLHLDRDSGIEATRLIRARYPRVTVLVVTMLDDDDSIYGALRAGASGYLLKGASPAEVERGIRAVAAGSVLLGPAVGARAVDLMTARASAPEPFPQLTEREREVLRLVAGGLDNTAIAYRLALRPKTVRNHVSSIFVKLQVKDRSQAIVRAREQGLGGP